MSDFRIEGLHAFAAGLNADADMIDDLVGKAARGIALGALRGVVMSTPVDTGRARGNWQVDVNKVPEGESGVLDRGGGETVSRGASAIASAQPYDMIALANNVPYIGDLNDGSSKQAPAGFVDTAVDNAIGSLE
ncbi:MAG: HK97 gp10 family phage protein [Pseudomonadota bacterium]|nr:HK97 gp10 family phage protein [Pseudomonadota bacterium]